MTKLGKNEPCPCGSNKKYKKCHGASIFNAKHSHQTASPKVTQATVPPESVSQPDGLSFLFSFPFHIFVDNTTPLTIKEITVDDSLVRIYPPFRSGKANFIPMPEINVQKIPFVKGVVHRIDSNFKIPNLVVVPQIESGKHSLLPTDRPDEQFKSAFMPMDSLRIDVIAQPASKARNVCFKSVSNLIQIIRVNTNQWRMEQMSDAGLLRATFNILKDGKPLEKPWGEGKGTTFGEKELSLNEVIWQQSITELENGLIPVPYKLIILDAKYLSLLGDIRRSVLDATIACEQARDVQFERLFQSQNAGKPFRISKFLSNHSLPTHLSNDLLKLSNGKHSYEQAEPERFEKIEDLWNVRENIAHRRPNQFYRDGIQYEINSENLKIYIEAVEHCIDWLENI